MKVYRLLTVFLTLFASALLAEITVESWQFNDGTSLRTTTNDGTWATVWDADLDDSSISDGNLVVQAGNKTANPTAWIAPAITGGRDKYILQVAFSEWSFSGADTWSFNVGLTSGAYDGTWQSAEWLGRLWFRWTGSNVRLFYEGSSVGGNSNWTTGAWMGPNHDSADPIRTVGMQLDFDTGDVSVLVDGSEVASWTGLAPTDMGAIVLDKYIHGGGTSVTGSVSIDSITLTLLGGDVDPSPTTWAGYNVEEDGVSVDTGDFLGWVDILYDPWIWSYSLESYVYLPETYVINGGGWFCVMDYPFP